MNRKSPALVTLRKASANASRSGFLGEAQTIALRAVELAQRVAGPESQEYFECAGDVALRSYENGDLTLAEQYQLIVLESAKRLFGDQHIIVAEQLRVLAEILRAGGDEFGAKAAEKRAASIFERAHITISERKSV